MILPRHSLRNGQKTRFYKAAMASDDLAAMLVTSQYLQRLALRHGEDVGPCLNGQAASQINIAKTHFIASMQSAGDEKTALRAIRIWRERTALMVALSDLAGREDMPQQMQWLSEAAQTGLVGNDPISVPPSRATRQDQEF
jgi:glutamine synthetase adenylyltransferase